jgi:hypothetical protein
MPTNLLIKKTLEAAPSFLGRVLVADFKMRERVEVFRSFVEIYSLRNESVHNVTSSDPPQDRGFKITR